mmetsp:Transcript_34377/g.62311  ORF Transcript_34377/g.62311 Transcript_34377/m.62311 type:complete len:129 (+) Transcript_34377:2-388(+)
MPPVAGLCLAHCYGFEEAETRCLEKVGLEIWNSDPIENAASRLSEARRKFEEIERSESKLLPAVGKARSQFLALLVSLSATQLSPRIASPAHRKKVQQLLYGVSDCLEGMVVASATEEPGAKRCRISR